MFVLFVGGGTLGSVTPLLAVAEEIRRQSEISPPKADPPREENFKFQISFWGTRRGPERALVESAGIPFRSILAGKLRRYWDIRNLFDLVIVKWAFWVALIRFIRWRPSVVVGAGSFVQVPVMWAAWVLRIPILIHQLDVRPSLANRLVAPFATRITVTFPASAKAFRNAEVVGTPARRAILAARSMDQCDAKRRFGFSGNRPVVLFLGGGTGAEQVNNFVRSGLADLAPVADVIHVTGRGKSIDVSGHPVSARERYCQFALLTKALPRAYAAADLVVSRAGIGTIAELAMLGKTMVLIPMPGTHQEANAAACAAAGAAVVPGTHQPPTYYELLERVVSLLADAARRAELSRAAVALFPSDAATHIADMAVLAASETIKSNPSA